MHKRKQAKYSENYLGGNIILDRLVVMDDVSGFRDRPEEFAIFLTVSKNTD